MHPGPKQAYPHFGLGGFLKKALKFEWSHTKNLLKGLKKDPKRLILGVDPFSTKVWNKILGRDDRALVNQLGGATKHDYQTAVDEGIDIGPGATMQSIAGVIAGAYAGGALGQAAGAGITSTTGATVSPVAQTGISNAARVGVVTGTQALEDSAPLEGGGGGGAPWDPGPGEQLAQATNPNRNFYGVADPSTYGQGAQHLFFEPPKPAARGGKVQKYARGGARRFAPDGGGRGGRRGRGAWADPPSGLSGLYAPQQIPYAIPAPSTREGTDFDPGSIAEEIYEKYGIIDPTWTEYDRTSQAKMQEDPLAHLGEDDPAREEYVSWEQGRAADEAQRREWDAMGAYPDTERNSSHREKLRQHKSKVADILGGSEGGTVRRYQQGGLAAAMQGRMGQQRGFGGGRPPQRGGRMGSAMQRMQAMRGQRGGAGMPQAPQAMRGPMQPLGGPQPQQAMQPSGPGGSPEPQAAMQMQQQIQQQRAPAPAPQQAAMQSMMQGQRGAVPQQRMGMRPPMGPPSRGPMKQLGGPGGVQPGGPGGMPGGREMISPEDAAMPGGRAMPFRGFQQKRAMQRRGNLGGNRVGQSDQQGGLSRALQKGTGRPPMSRRSAFPGQRG